MKLLSEEPARGVLQLVKNEEAVHAEEDAKALGRILKHKAKEEQPTK